MSAPFIAMNFTCTNPDGSTIRVRGSGDQNYGVFETLDGYSVVKDPDSGGIYKCGTLSEDKNTLGPTDIDVGQGDRESLGSQHRIRVRQAGMQEKVHQSPLKQGPKSRWETRRGGKKSFSAAVMPTTRPEAMPQSVDEAMQQIPAGARPRFMRSWSTPNSGSHACIHEEKELK